jgi:hypothetical protein
MNRRLALILAFVCAAVLQASAMPAAAQTPVPAQASPQTVRAAIPPQATTTPTPAAVPQPATAVAPVAASTPQVRPAVVQPPTPLRAEPAPAPKFPFDTEAANVKVEVTITYQVGNAAPVKRMATLMVADQGRGSLRSGNQVAVPSTTYLPVVPAKSEGGVPAPAAPLTSFTYKSVGLNLDANRVYIQGNKARMDLSVEFSAIDEKPSDGSGRPPSFPTFSQNLTLVLENGKSVIVGQSSDFVDNVERKQTVEVKATILR